MNTMNTMASLECLQSRSVNWLVDRHNSFLFSAEALKCIGCTISAICFSIAFLASHKLLIFRSRIDFQRSCLQPAVRKALALFGLAYEKTRLFDACRRGCTWCGNGHCDGGGRQHQDEFELSHCEWIASFFRKMEIELKMTGFFFCQASATD